MLQEVERQHCGTGKKTWLAALCVCDLLATTPLQLDNFSGIPHLEESTQVWAVSAKDKSCLLWGLALILEFSMNLLLSLLLFFLFPDKQSLIPSMKASIDVATRAYKDQHLDVVVQAHKMSWSLNQGDVSLAIEIEMVACMVALKFLQLHH